MILPLDGVAYPVSYIVPLDVFFMENLFGFMAYGDSIEYKMFTYDEAEGFKEVFSKDIVNYGNVRGLYIGETFYLVAGNTVESFTLIGFEKLDDLVL